ncbi:TonB-dependent receptor [Chryseotalea sanaruensis]|uniref:TonB-dependent receptor n=1 Tax=Chryseotalea sanaruensis TaxID=2482724 RepID=A0A401U876_9BACT|nr:TonB-dependent receptor [Chryseotalea sanaruensis]GCC51092.1 TonB-dependent receptor [Chryseotalea sanaruensis]
MLKTTSLLLSFLTIISWQTYAQGKFKISGIVIDAESGKALVGANVSVKNSTKGVIAGDSAAYQIWLSPGAHTLVFSFIGFGQKELEVIVDRSISLNVSLSPTVSNLDEVMITDNKAEENISKTEIGSITLSKKELETLPYLLGEMDPIRILQLMPGVQTAGEGNTGFYVRGGAVDQNLMVLDNSIVYNPSHLFGFFSVFNGSTINDLEMHKGGIPSYYGGRLSSFTKITTRKGNDQKVKGEGGIGILSSNLLLEGPIKKNKGSFLVAGRRTYIDLFIDPIRELFSVPEKIDYYFYDLNINADYRINERNQLSFRAYLGKDDFYFNKDNNFANTIRWGNGTASLRWSHIFTDNLTGELSLSTVLYDMDFGASINTYQFNIVSDIRDNGFQYLLDLQKRKHHLVFGTTYTHHKLRPNNVGATSDDVSLEFGNNEQLFAHEASLFLNDKITLTEKLEINAGIRYTYYSQFGPFTRYAVDDNLQLLDTVVYRKNERVVHYVNPEPRLSVRFNLNQVSSLKAAYDRGYQYMHMAPLSSASLPMDVWVTSSTKVKPQYGDQFSTGYFRNFNENMFESSLVLYYKVMHNQLEYKDGVIVGYSRGFNYDDAFVFGKGISYGAEVLIKKNTGKVTGTAAYTLSRTMREFEDLNQGNPFPAKYDRLHDISLMCNYKQSNKWTFSGVFVYGTGNALNLPVARYIIQGSIVNEYGERNSFRMPAYHRLDLAATYIARKSERFESAWIFSVYNLYNRRNPYYIYFETKGDLKEYKLETSIRQVSLFPVLPSVTYRFKF